MAVFAHSTNTGALIDTNYITYSNALANQMPDQCIWQDANNRLLINPGYYIIDVCIHCIICNREWFFAYLEVENPSHIGNYSLTGQEISPTYGDVFSGQMQMHINGMYYFPAQNAIQVMTDCPGNSGVYDTSANIFSIMRIG